MNNIIKKFLYNKSIQPFYWFAKNIIETVYDFLYENLFSKFHDFGKTKTFVQWKRIIKNKKSFIFSNDQKLNILMVPFNGYAETVLAFETAIGKSLELKGHDITILSCDAALPSCQWNFDGNGNPKFESSKIHKFDFNKLDICKKCNKNISKVCQTSSLKMKPLSNYSSQNIIDDAIKFINSISLDHENKIVYKGINISEHAYSTTIRVLLRGSLDTNDSYSNDLYKRFLISAVILTDHLEKLFRENNFDRIVAVHGIYLEHGIICDFAVKENIPVIIWGTPYRKNCIYAAHNDTYHRELVYEKNSEWNDLILDEKMNSQLDIYLNSKLSGGRDYVNYHPNPITDKEKLIREIGLDPNKPIIGLFTNVLWDAQIFYDSNAFENMLEWINYTISNFINRKDVQLVIRIHPAESKGGFTTNQPLEQEILSSFDSLPENIKIVSPESNISSYTLADISAASLVYGTNMALEIAIRGLPLVIVGECCSRGKGFSYDIETKSDYDKILEKIYDLKKPTKNQINLARKYAYHLFFRRMIDFNVYDTPISGKTISRQAKFNFRSTKELIDNNIEGLDIVCNGIINLEKFIKK